MQPALLTIKEFVSASGLRERSVRKLLADGRLRHVKVGRKHFVPAAELQGFIERNVQPPPAQDDGDGPED